MWVIYGGSGSNSQTWYGFISEDKSTILSWQELIDLGYAQVDGGVLLSLEIPARPNSDPLSWCGDLFISNDITEIHQFCIFLEYSVKNIYLPDTVTIIGAANFHGCQNLESVYVPASVLSVGTNCFGRCAENSKVYCEVESQPENWNLRQSDSIFIYGCQF